MKCTEEAQIHVRRTGRPEKAERELGRQTDGGRLCFATICAELSSTGGRGRCLHGGVDGWIDGWVDVIHSLTHSIIHSINHPFASILQGSPMCLYPSVLRVLHL